MFIKISCLRPIKGVTIGYRMINWDIGMECGLKYKLSARVDQSIMNWYEHMERKEAFEANLESRSGWNERKR